MFASEKIRFAAEKIKTHADLYKKQTKQLQIYSKQHLSSYYTLINYRICDCSRVSSTEYKCSSALGLVDSPNLLQKSVHAVFLLYALLFGVNLFYARKFTCCVLLGLHSCT